MEVRQVGLARTTRCIRAREQVSLRLDGVLSEFENALLNAHLAQCEDCRAFEGDIADVTEWLRAEPLEPLAKPVALPLRRRRSVLRGVQAAAAAAAVAAVGLTTALTLVESEVVQSPRVVNAARFGADEDRMIRRVRLSAMRPVPSPRPKPPLI